MAQTTRDMSFGPVIVIAAIVGAGSDATSAASGTFNIWVVVVSGVGVDFVIDSVVVDKVLKWAGGHICVMCRSVFGKWCECYIYCTNFSAKYTVGWSNGLQCIIVKS